MFGFDFSTLMTIATLAAKYGPTVFSLAEKFGPLATKLIHATVPVVKEELNTGRLQNLSNDTLKQVKIILAGFGHSTTPEQDSRIGQMISEEEERQARRADGTNEDGTPKFGI